MKTREEAIVEADKAASNHRKRAQALKAERLSNAAIARALGISGTLGMSAEKKVDVLLNSKKP